MDLYLKYKGCTLSSRTNHKQLIAVRIILNNDSVNQPRYKSCVPDDRSLTFDPLRALLSQVPFLHFRWYQIL